MTEDPQNELLATATECLVNVCIEGWRFTKAYLRVTSKLDAGEIKKSDGPWRYFIRQMEEKCGRTVGITLVNIEGQLFGPGIAANAVNIQDFTEGEPLFVDQMLEPIVMGPNGLGEWG